MGRCWNKKNPNLDLDAKRIADNPKWCDHYNCDCHGPSLNEVRRNQAAQEKEDHWREELEEERKLDAESGKH